MKAKISTFGTKGFSPALSLHKTYKFELVKETKDGKVGWIKDDKKTLIIIRENNCIFLGGGTWEIE